MKILTKDMKIFSYRIKPACGMEGDDGGFSIELYGNGNLRYCVYQLFDDIKLLEMFKLNKEVVYAVYEIIDHARKQLDAIPENLNNGSMDGVINEFLFDDFKWITAVSIQETFVKGMILKNYSYYRKYKENMKYENTVLRIFKEICKVLKGAGVDLSLESCEIRLDSKLRVTW